MKQVLFLAGALLVTTSIQAQTTVNFEDLTLPQADTFYTGEDNAGQFISHDVIFENDYETTQWGYSWGGFAYSNMTDDQNGGLNNQYSSFAGSGANASENYAIYYNADTLILPGIGASFGNVSITNTAYAGISMRDGDQFAKQFGSPNGADGQPDGTNGEDYFYVTIYGWNQQDILVDSTEIYLADFRFADNNQDYILKDWADFDLSMLDGSKYLTFKFYSSDMGDFGINTPLYFAMDNLVYSEYINNLNLQVEESISIFPNPANEYINIKFNNGAYVILSNLGEVIKEGKTDQGPIDISSFTPGLYFVTNSERSITEKLIIR